MGVRRSTFLILLSIMILVVAACGGADEASPTTPATDQSSDDGSNDSEGNGEGNGSESGSPGSDAEPGDLPPSVSDDFPIPIPAGWEIDIHGEIGLSDTSAAQLLYPADAFDGLVAFYDDWHATQPGETSRTEAGDKVIYTGGGDLAAFYTIAITPNEEQRDETWVLLQVTTGGG